MSDFNENQNNEQLDTAETVAPEQPSFAEAEAHLINGAEPAKKKPVLLIAAVIVVILAAAMAAVYNFVPWVKNNVKMLISKPESYYLWVEQENLESMADSISEGYGKSLDATATKGEFELKADIDSANVGALIETITGSPLSESGITLPANIAIKGGVEMSEAGNADITYMVNAADKTLATLNMFMKDKVIYLQIPELSSAYLSVDPAALMSNEIGDAATNSFMKGYMDTMMNMSPETLKEMLSEDELNELIVKYFTIVFENLDDVELEKGVSCDVNGVKTDYNVLSADVNQGAVFSIAKDVLKEAKNDKTIIKIVEKFGVTKEDYATAVDGLLEELGTLEVSGGETVFTMNVYVDSEGKICGRDVEIPQQENAKLGYMIAENGSDTAFDVNFVIDGEGVQILGNDTEKSGKESGEVKVALFGANEDGSNVEIPVSYKDIEIVDEEKGYCKGEISIDMSFAELPVITVALDSDGKSQTIKSDVVVEGKNYGTITLTSKEELSLTMPKFDSAQQVYSMNDDAQMESYITAVSGNIAGFLDNVGAAFGVNGLGTMMMGGMADSLVVDDSTLEEDFAIENIDDESVDSDFEEPEFVEYDFSKIDVKLNGQSVTFPSKIDGIFDYVNTSEEPQVDAGGYTSYYNDDYTFGVMVENNTDSAVAAKESVVTGVEVSNGSDVSVTFDGLSVGANIQDFVAKYGFVLDNPKEGYVSIYDSNSDWNEMMVYYYDGIVESVGIEIMEY